LTVGKLLLIVNIGLFYIDKAKGGGRSWRLGDPVGMTAEKLKQLSLDYNLPLHPSAQHRVI
jgi:hypothetical protein